MARAHPYNFTHHLLPQLAWRRPEAVRRELSDPQLARELLHYLWDKAGETVVAAERVVPRGLRLHWHEVAGRATALLLLPTPAATTEAYCAALVYETDPIPPGRLSAIEDEEDEEEGEESDELLPRYFTLEATLGLHDGRARPRPSASGRASTTATTAAAPPGAAPTRPPTFWPPWPNCWARRPAPTRPPRSCAWCEHFYQ